MKEDSCGGEFLFCFITNDFSIAQKAEKAGVGRIGPDLEILGKETRQKHYDARISRHTVEDVKSIRRILTNAEVFVRINPIHSNSKYEINNVIDAGAQSIMLPMFRTAFEVSNFVSMVRERAKAILLLETPEAMMRIDEILSVGGIREIHFGLNDLHLGLKLHSRFEVLCSELMDALAEAALKRGIPYGFGALGRPHDLSLPIPPDQIVGEITRLGASRAFLSRYFIPPRQEPFDLSQEVLLLRERIAYWRSASSEVLQKNRQLLRESVRRYREERSSFD